MFCCYIIIFLVHFIYLPLYIGVNLPLYFGVYLPLYFGVYLPLYFGVYVPLYFGVLQMATGVEINGEPVPSITVRVSGLLIG